MKEYYCCADGVNVLGPHSVEELSEMIREGVLAKEAFAARAGDQTCWNMLEESDLEIVLPLIS